MNQVVRDNDSDKMDHLWRNWLDYRVDSLLYTRSTRSIIIVSTILMENIVLHELLDNGYGTNHCIYHCCSLRPARQKILVLTILTERIILDYR
jgi:hypothetical protein